MSGQSAALAQSFVDPVLAMSTPTPSPGQLKFWEDYLVGQLAPAVAIAALARGGVSVTRQELLAKLKMGGLAKRSDCERKLVERYDKARQNGTKRIRTALKTPYRSCHAAERHLLKSGWKTVGVELLSGADANDIFKAEAALHKLAPRLFYAVHRIVTDQPKKHRFAGKLHK